ncbi:MAG: hypothetical protein WCH32_13130 [Pseudomonadota bacterium]
MGDGPLQRGWLLALLLFGIAFVAAYDLALGPVRYPYAADSASYIEMADSLYHEGRPLVTPWDLDDSPLERIPQALFPPGFPLLVAAVIPFAGDARSAALWPGRVAAALTPLLIALLFRGAFSAGLLVLLASFALVTPGLRGWQFLAYSDASAAALAIIALGALARGLGLAGAARLPARGWLFAAGLAAGAAYGIRNAGLAVLAAAVFTLGWHAWRGRGGLRALCWWLAGALPPLAALWCYNLATFGKLQPYTMPVSTRSLLHNVGDYALAQITDLGLPWQVAEHTPALLAAAVMALLAAVTAAGWWRLRDNPRRQGLLTLLGGYAFGGGLLLIASRSRYEWGGLIDVRNTLQYTWALALAAALAVEVLVDARLRRLARLGGTLLVLFLLGSTVHEVVAVRAGGQEVWQLLNRDPRVLAAAADAPPETFLASNQAVLFRIGTGRHVRNLEVSGADRDFNGSLALLARAAGRRPALMLLVCDDWTRAYAVCGGTPELTVVQPECSAVRVRPPRVWACRPRRMD